MPNEEIEIRREEIYHSRLESILEDELDIDIGEKIVGVGIGKAGYILFKITEVRTDSEWEKI